MAAAESFLAFNPAGRAGAAAASRRRSRGPRNRKKGWKRWSGPEARLGREIGDFLEDVGLQERAAGCISAHQTPNGRKERRRRQFWEKKAEIGVFPRREPRTPPHLWGSHFCAPPPSISAHQTPNGRKERRRRQFWEKKAEIGVFPRRERRLRARLARGQTPAPQKPPELGRSDPLRDFYDIWGEHSESGGLFGGAWD
ncbi:ribosome biogenesis protein NOP53, partial [Passer montanus]|uniref:ribosome biogenesis protein NOP53 n=1 Tax=Passer montanus TaxID=9160 RepID=UPI001960EAFE